MIVVARSSDTIFDVRDYMAIAIIVVIIIKTRELVHNELNTTMAIIITYDMEDMTSQKDSIEVERYLTKSWNIQSIHG